MSCSVRSLKEAEPYKTSHGLSGFLYMEEVYAFARNNFSAGKFDESIKWYERLDEDFPNNPYRSESLFIRGYIFNSFKDDPVTATACFNEIIEKYPGSEFYNSAKFELEHINDPDFMPQFEK
jgi:outer membrane protein assembly factor BamD (BamD/ComL family)